jgi:hypothetical protein
MLSRQQLQGLRNKSIEPYIYAILNAVHKEALAGGTCYQHSLPGFDRADAENFVTHLKPRFPDCIVTFIDGEAAPHQIYYTSHAVRVDWT